MTNHIATRSISRNVRRIASAELAVSETVITIRRVGLILAVLAIGYFTVVGILQTAVTHGWAA
ncbi:hypothetical protein [Rhodococcus sp. PvR044]|uniref:hypothetical protein n=1 Tax=Rhodococcus sp. PvR044 TaxID=3156402 RepID=UPI0033939AA4